MTETITPSPKPSQNNDIPDMISLETEKKMEKKNKKRKHKKSEEQTFLIHLTTRIALTCILSMVSSCIAQIIWLIADEIGYSGIDMLWAYYLHPTDSVINIFCVYFSMAFAKNHYQRICHDICRLHQCFLCCIMKIVDWKTNKKHTKPPTLMM